MLYADSFAKFNIESEKDFYLTNYYADRVFNKVAYSRIDQDMDGILYPSVANNYRNLNIVLKPESVKSKLKFIEANHWIVTNDIRNRGTVSWLPIKGNRRADEDGNMIWDPKHD